MDENSVDQALQNEVQTIRKILFGEHLKAVESRMAELESMLESLKKENLELKKQITSESSTRGAGIKELEKQFRNEIAALQKKVESGNDSFQAETANHFQKIKKDTEDLSEDLVALRAQLSDHRHNQSNLIGRLAQALAVDHGGEPTDNSST